MNKTLSIVIPTLNRYEYLKRTLNFIIPQVERNLDRIELIVACNASKDDTDIYMKDIVTKYPFVKYVYFDDYVEVGYSLIRSVDLASGEYVVLWGDDDIPFPYFSDTILDIVDQNPNIGVIFCNRLQGKDTKYGMKNLKLLITEYEEENGLYNLNDFINKFTIHLGFISSLVFKRTVWDKGRSFFNKEFYGYEHLSIILNGAKGCNCFYYNLPLEIQRQPYSRDFDSKWALYYLVGIPNMMADFDKNGLSEGALEHWEEMGCKSLTKFIWQVSYTSLDKKYYKSIRSDLLMYQRTRFRKLLTLTILYLMTKKLFVFLKNRIYND